MSLFNGREFGRCMVFYGFDKLSNTPKVSIEEFVLPNKNDELKEGQVLLKLSLATVCGSDLHTLRGRRKEPVPTVLGHEGYGKVILSNRQDINIGDIVTFTLCNVCHDCVRCHGGIEQKCKNLTKYGHLVYESVDAEYVCMDSAHSFAFSAQSIVPMGCYSTHILLDKGTTIVNLAAIDTSDIKELNSRDVLKSLQKSVSSLHSMNLWPTFNCAFATMVHAMEKLMMNFEVPSETEDIKKIGNKKSALILGGGLLGLYGIILLKHHFGQSIDISCCDIDEGKRDVITKLGATFIKGKAEEDKEYDLLIEVCGVKQAVMDNLHVLKPGGLLILVGLCVPNSALDITAEKIIRNCWTLLGIYNYRSEHLKKAVQLAATSDHVFKALSIIKACVSSPIGLAELQIRLEADDSEKYFKQFHRVLVDPHK